MKYGRALILFLLVFLLILACTTPPPGSEMSAGGGVQPGVEGVPRIAVLLTAEDLAG